MQDVYDFFVQQTGSKPEQLDFKRGLKSDQWYAKALYF
jgi:hypothetical protein